MRYSLYKIFTFLPITIGIGFTANAQRPEDIFKKLSAIPTQSPQAASLSKYVEFPVSYYTGLAHISLPVYEVKTGDISVPISLSYHGGGIKVNEEASWVGLGWTLDAGGVISHDIKGEDDNDGTFNHQFNQVFPNDNGTAYNAFSISMPATPSNGVYTQDHTSWNPTDFYTQFSSQVHSTDGEPDLYVYNFGQYSGKFFSGSGGFVDMSHNNILFQYSGAGFKATTPDGYTYEFQVLEKAWTYPTTHATITAYYLTSITSPKGKTISFQYKSFKTLISAYASQSIYPDLASAWGNDETIMQLPTLSEHFTRYQLQEIQSTDTYSAETPGLHQSYSMTSTSNYYLDKIIFDNGYVDFVKSPRSDLYGFQLDAINIYRSNGSLVKTIPFSYDYFISTKNDDDMFNPNKVSHLETNGIRYDYYPVEFRNRRLKLRNVTIDACPHSFEYEEGTDATMLPFKTSFSQDFWGYYNGKSNPSLIPDYALYNQQASIPSQVSDWTGANRNPDENYLKAGILKRINYPEGGYSEFTYEINQFGNLTQQQQTTYNYVQKGGVDAGVGTQKFYFTLTQRIQCDITGGLYCNGMQDMNSSTYNCNCMTCPSGLDNALYAMIEQVDAATHASIGGNPAYKFDISNDVVKNANGSIYLPDQWLDAGTYCITVNYPDNHNPPGDIQSNRRAELYVSYYEPVQGQVVATNLGAGLRVASIKHIDPVNNQSLQRNFSYNSGKMMRFPVFYSAITLVHPSAETDGGGYGYYDYYQFHYLYSNPATPYSFSASGSPGGYDMVTETQVGSTSLGKTEYYYKNLPDRVNSQPNTLPGVPSASYLENGSLDKVIVYDNDNNILKETINESTVGVSNTYWPFKSKYVSDGNLITPLDFGRFFFLDFYPVPIGKLLTTRTTEKDYSNGTAMNTVKEFQYNENGLLKQEKLTTSDGSILTTNYSYASDYTGVSSGWINDLKTKNFIAVPLEILAKRNGLVTGGTFTTYLVNNFGTTNFTITPSQVYRIETKDPQNISSTVPNGVMPSQLKSAGTLNYDENGNLKQARADNNIYTSYLWGYNNVLPIAQVVNAQQKDIFYTSFEDGDGNSIDGDSKTGLKSWTGASTFSKTLSGLSPLDYTLTYWLKTGGTWVLQKQAISSGQIVNGSYTISLNGQIDEVKFYPKNAQMSTFAYDPLIGMTTQSDINDRITSYEYDDRCRLLHVRDFNGKLLKRYEYFCSVASDVAPRWQATGRTRVITQPCSYDASYTVDQPQEELQDINPYSSTYNTTMWVINGMWTATADWQTVSTVCELSNNHNTGNQIITKKDMNPCSSTYNQLQTTVISNTTSCPLPPPCDANCTGPSFRCINGVCETGQYGVVSKLQEYDSNGNPICVLLMGYTFSDGTTITSGSIVEGGICQ